MKIEDRIKKLKLTLTELPKALGSYIPAVRCGNIVTTSGQLPISEQRLIFPGRVDKEVTVENAQRAAKAALLNCLSAVRSVIGDLDKVKKVIRLNGFVCSALAFNDHPRVLNGASDLLIEIFGQEIGSHTRTAIGVFELPMKACVELDLTVEVSV